MFNGFSESIVGEIVVKPPYELYTRVVQDQLLVTAQVLFARHCVLHVSFSMIHVLRVSLSMLYCSFRARLLEIC